MDHYILQDRMAVPVADLLEWARQFESLDRRVAKTYVGDVHISTMFLGIDHQWGSGPPLLFETMVFGGPLDQEQERYSTWEEAEEGHRRMVERVRLSVTHAGAPPEPPAAADPDRVASAPSTHG